MNTAEQNTKQGMEESDVIKQFMQLLSQQDMGEQSQGFMEMFGYLAGMQMQLSIVADELQGMREQLAKLQESQPKTVTERLMDKVAQLQEKATGLSERLSSVKERLMETAAQALLYGYPRKAGIPKETGTVPFVVSFYSFSSHFVADMEHIV